MPEAKMRFFLFNKLYSVLLHHGIASKISKLASMTFDGSSNNVARASMVVVPTH